MRNTNRYFKILAALAILVSCFACRPQVDDVFYTEELRVPDEFMELYFSSNNKEGQEITFYANRNWTIVSDMEWVHVSAAKGGGGDQQVTVTVDENVDENGEPSYDNRTAKLIVGAGRLIKTIIVRQSQVNGIVATQKHYDLKMHEQVLKVDLTANSDDIEVLIPQDVNWIERTEAPTRGMSTKSIYLKIKENTGTENRNAKITFKNKEAEDFITIRQYDASEITIPELKYDIDCRQQVLGIDVTSNIDVEVLIPNEATWIKRNPVQSYAMDLSTSTYEFLVDENTTQEGRSTIITFRNVQKEITVEVEVKQEMFHTIAEVQFTTSGELRLELEKLPNPEGYTKIVVEGPALLPADLGAIEELLPNVEAYDISGTETIEIPDSYYLRKTKVKSYKFPNTLKKIGTNAFHGTSLSELYLPASVESFGNSTFARCASLKRAELAPGAKVVGSLMFFECRALETVILPSTIEDWPIEPGGAHNKAFYSCDNLKTVNLPEGISAMGSHAFFGSKVEEMRIPSTITNWIVDPTYGNNATFINVLTLKRIEFADGLTMIGKNMLSGCRNLEVIVSESKVPPVVQGDIIGPNIGVDAPAGLKIIVPAGSRAAYQAAKGWEQYKAFIVEN